MNELEKQDLNCLEFQVRMCFIVLLKYFLTH